MDLQKELTTRQVHVLVEMVFGIILLFLSIWAIYVEFGWNVFNNSIPLLIFLYLAFFGYILFRIRWRAASEKSTDEKIDELYSKIDELIKEMRRDRDERKRRQ